MIPITFDEFTEGGRVARCVNELFLRALKAEQGSAGPTWGLSGERLRERAARLMPMDGRIPYLGPIWPREEPRELIVHYGPRAPSKPGPLKQKRPYNRIAAPAPKQQEW